jgi:hypothetical protein
MPVAVIAQQSQQQHVEHHDRYTVTDLGVLGEGTNSSGVIIADKWLEDHSPLHQRAM